MKKTTIVMLAAAFVLFAGTAAAASSPPAIRFVDLIPATAHGTHFGPREQVKVTLWAGTTKRVRATRASTTGAFTVDFGTLDNGDRCSGQMSLLAVGARGHSARYKLPTLACPMMTTGDGR